MMRLNLTFWALMAICSLNGQDLLITEIMYDNPGLDLEFIEFYNNTDQDLDLDNYTVDEGIRHSFNNVVIAPGETYVITDNAAKFNSFYGFDAAQWEGANLSNSGEIIEVLNASGELILSLEYSASGDWPLTPAGNGASLTLCDLDGDINDPASWKGNNNLVRESEGRKVYADPGVFNGCAAAGTPIVTSSFSTFIIPEKDDNIRLEVFVDEAPATMTTYAVNILSSSTATVDVDFTLLDTEIEFDPSTSSSERIDLDILVDEEVEGIERIALELVPDNTDFPVLNIDISIIDDDGPLTSALQLRGVIHGQNFKAVEVFAKEDISRIEFFGLGTGNNAGGSDGLELVFPTGPSIPAGSCIYVTDDTLQFKRFFGAYDNDLLIQDLEWTANFNGNDGVELYENCQIIDIFGFSDVDGTGTQWDYEEGWAKRKEDSLFNRVVFEPNDWEYSGAGVLDEVISNTSLPLFRRYSLTCDMPSSSTADFQTSTVSTYPNPTNGFVYMESEVPFENVQVQDILGNTFYRSTRATHYLEMDLSLVEAQLLFVSYEQFGQQYVTKLVVR